MSESLNKAKPKNKTLPVGIQHCPVQWAVWPALHFGQEIPRKPMSHQTPAVAKWQWPSASNRGSLCWGTMSIREVLAILLGREGTAQLAGQPELSADISLLLNEPWIFWATNQSSVSFINCSLWALSGLLYSTFQLPHRLSDIILEPTMWYLHATRVFEWVNKREISCPNITKILMEEMGSEFG